MWQTVDSWQPGRLATFQRDADQADFLTLQQSFEGGGRIIGEFGPTGFATIAEALDAPLGPPVATPDLDDSVAVEAACDELEARRQALSRGHGRRLAGQLVALCEASLAGVDGDGTRIDPRPTVHVVISADALLDVDRTPGWLLTPLAGGRMRASTALVQRLVDQRGADLHAVVLDEVGQVVGVGTGSYRPPGWLREAIWARDTVDISPDGRTPVRRCDLDHIIPWPDGPTDVDNLQPIGRTAHRMKTRRKWKVTRARDGTTTWTHRPTGLDVTRPPTWRQLAPPD